MTGPVRTILPMPARLEVQHRTGFDLYGKPAYGKPRKTRCAVLRLRKSVADTTVRADSSGTRGHAQEVLSDAWLLFAHNDDIRIGDKLTIAGFAVKVTGIQPRFGVFGAHDHNEVEGDIENDEAQDNGQV